MTLKTPRKSNKTVSLLTVWLAFTLPALTFQKQENSEAAGLEFAGGIWEKPDRLLLQDSPAGPGLALHKGERERPLMALLLSRSILFPAPAPTAAITALAFHPHQELLAIGTFRAILLLDIKTGDVTSRLEGHAEFVRSVSISPDGQLLAAGSGLPARYGEIRIYDLAFKKDPQVIRGHKDAVYKVAFSPDGKLLATSGYEGVAKLWDVTSGKEVRAFTDHKGAVLALAFSPDGKWLATASADRTAKVWSLETGEALYTLAGAMDQLTTIVYHPSGEMIAAGSIDRFIRVWKLPGKETKASASQEPKESAAAFAHEGDIFSLVFTRDGKQVISSGADRTVKFWNSENLKPLHALEKQSEAVLSLAVNPSGEILALGRYDGSLDLYKLDPVSRPTLLKQYAGFGGTRTSTRN